MCASWQGYNSCHTSSAYQLVASRGSRCYPPASSLEELRALGRRGWEAPGCLGCVLPCASYLLGVLRKKEGAAKGPALVYVFYSCVPVSAAISLQLPKPCATVLVQAFPLAAVLLEENWDTGEAGERKALKWLRCSSL